MRTHVVGSQPPPSCCRYIIVTPSLTVPPSRWSLVSRGTSPPASSHLCWRSLSQSYSLPCVFLVFLLLLCFPSYHKAFCFQVTFHLPVAAFTAAPFCPSSSSSLLSKFSFILQSLHIVGDGGGGRSGEDKKGEETREERGSHGDQR